MEGALAAAARSCDIKLFGNYTVAGVLDGAAQQAGNRDLDVVELWSGVGSVVAAAEGLGYRAHGFDIFRIPGLTDVPGPMCEDITLETGFVKATSHVLRLRPAGLLGMAPVCSSFVFPNSSNTRRTRTRWQGDEEYPPVQRGNLMAQEAAFLMCVALARDVHFFIENPAGSTMFSYLQSTLALFPGLKYCISNRCAYSTEPIGQRFWKPYKFVTSGPWLDLAKCVCPGRLHTKLMDTDERGRQTGNLQALQASASYPPALGQALVQAWVAAGPVASHSLTDTSDVRTSRVKPARQTRSRVGGATSRSRSRQGPWSDADPSPPPSPEGPWNATRSDPASSPQNVLSSRLLGEVDQSPEGPWSALGRGDQDADSDPWG
jgi:hypothetical protein